MSMDFYPNYKLLNDYFIKNFNDYELFLNSLSHLKLSDDTYIYDLKQNKFISIHDNYLGNIYFENDHLIIDSYLNVLHKKLNLFIINTYINFPSYILYLLNYQSNIESRFIGELIIELKKEFITEFGSELNNNQRNLIIDWIDKLKLNDNVKFAHSLLNLTKFIIFNTRDTEIEDDIEDTIYLKNRLKETKFTIDDLKNEIEIKNKKIIDQLELINHIKLKNRKLNFKLIENDDLFGKLDNDTRELNEKIISLEYEGTSKENKIKDQENKIKDQENKIKNQENKIKEMENTFIYRCNNNLQYMMDGLNILFNRFHF
jgi:hypothetical protein